MGKRLIIPGADFSGAAIAPSPFAFIVPAGESITINGISYGREVESYYELNSVPTSGLNGAAAISNLKEVVISAPFTAAVQRYVGNQTALEKFILKATAVPEETFSWFLGCTNIKTIKGLKNVDFSGVTNVYGMFYACNALESVDLAGVDFSNVGTFTLMFSSCNSLKEVGCDANNYATLLSCLQTDLSSKTWVVNGAHTLISAV